MKIRKLDDNVANMISAGEVVERPLSVVKELVENAVDAESTFIEIQLSEAGTQLIRVTDNGFGMSKEDALLAFERHATSKISSKNDLFHIASLGFRGEALPSIASVSKLKMISSQGETGYEVNIDGGKLISHKSSSARKGTLVEVRSLFYNTPARLKFLKSVNYELTLITDYITKMALSYPAISYVLVHNDKELINTDGSGDLLKVIKTIYGNEVSRNMKEISSKSYDYSIDGFITKQTVTRASRYYINVSVNNRVVRSANITNAVISAYGNRIPKGRYPVAFINIKCDPILVDVNVHPSKLQVKFTEEKKLLENISSVIVNTLSETVSIPKIQRASYENTESIDSSDFIVKEQITFFEEERFPVLEYIGQYSGTYLLFQGDGLYIIDQHAAEERIRFEMYLKSLKNSGETYELLVPINLEYSKTEFLEIYELLPKLKEIGVVLEESGENSFYVREVPVWFEKSYEKEFVDKLIYELISGEKDSFDDIAAQLACIDSIKGNSYISRDEVDELVRNLSKCDNPFNCPHGRPTIISFSKSEIERYFRR